MDDIPVILDQHQLTEKNVGTISSILNEIYDLLGKEGMVNFEDNIECIIVAGKGINSKTYGEINILLNQNDIEPKFSLKGSCLVYGIKGFHGAKAVNLIYDKYLR